MYIVKLDENWGEAYKTLGNMRNIPNYNISVAYFCFAICFITYAGYTKIYNLQYHC